MTDYKKGTLVRSKEDILRSRARWVHLVQVAAAVILMGKGHGRVELAILNELRQGDATINDLAIAASGLKAHVLYFPCNTPEWQSAARAVRSLIGKGLISRCGGAGKQQQKYQINN